MLLGFKIRAQYLPFSARSSSKNGALLKDTGEYWRYSSKLAEPQCCLVLVLHTIPSAFRSLCPRGDLNEIILILNKDQDGEPQATTINFNNMFDNRAFILKIFIN